MFYHHFLENCCKYTYHKSHYFKMCNSVHHNIIQPSPLSRSRIFSLPCIPQIKSCAHEQSFPFPLSPTPGTTQLLFFFMDLPIRGDSCAQNHTMGGLQSLTSPSMTFPGSFSRSLCQTFFPMIPATHRCFLMIFTMSTAVKQTVSSMLSCEAFNLVFHGTGACPWNHHLGQDVRHF